jgi:large subunit ribosomal protein L24
MKVRVGDTVMVIAGSDKGMTGEILSINHKTNKVVVEGVNVRKKHRKPTQSNPEGSIVDIYAPIHVSNVALIDPKTKKATRVGIKVENGKKIRVSVGKKASGSKLD